MKTNDQTGADQPVGSAYIAAALGLSQSHVSRALGSLFADGDYRVQQLGRQFVVSREDAAALIASWREDRPRGAPAGEKNGRHKEHVKSE